MPPGQLSLSIISLTENIVGATSQSVHPYQYPIPPDGHSHIPHPAEAPMRRDSNGSGNFLHANGPIGGGQPSTPQQLAQRSLDVSQIPDHNDEESSMRKRSKVSRACDECRRKKVIFPSKMVQ